MLGVEIPEGDLFYGRTRRRETVQFDHRLRDKTERVIQEVRDMFASGITPREAYEKRKCDRCSLRYLCLPEGTGPTRSPSRYLARSLAASLAQSAHHAPPEETST